MGEEESFGVIGGNTDTDPDTGALGPTAHELGDALVGMAGLVAQLPNDVEP